MKDHLTIRMENAARWLEKAKMHRDAARVTSDPGLRYRNRQAMRSCARFAVIDLQSIKRMASMYQ